MRTLDELEQGHLKTGALSGMILSYTKELQMTKCVRDRKVAVLYSPGYGAGWSTWNGDKYREFLLHDEKLVDLVEFNQQDKIEEYVKSVYPGEYIYCGGADQLRVEWVYPGTQFLITDYDGSESIQYKNDDYWSVA